MRHCELRRTQESNSIKSHKIIDLAQILRKIGFLLASEKNANFFKDFCANCLSYNKIN
jgi:hypothetical protein